MEDGQLGLPGPLAIVLQDSKIGKEIVATHLLEMEENTAMEILKRKVVMGIGVYREE